MICNLVCFLEEKDRIKGVRVGSDGRFGDAKPVRKKVLGMNEFIMFFVSCFLVKK